MKNSLLYKVSKKVYNGELSPPESGNFVSDQNLFNYQAKVLKELAEWESYVYVKRRTGNNPGSSNIKNYCT